MQLTVQQVADLLQATESQVRKWIRDRGLPAVMFNEQYRLNRTDVIIWAQENRIPVHVPLPAAANVSLAAALQAGGIHRALPGATRAAVLRSAVERLRLPAAVDRSLLLEMIEARERSGTTVVGHGIAIPHARYPNVAALAEPMLALAFLAAPVEFGEGGSVQTLFVLVAPTIRAHLELLGRLARALSGDLLAPVLDRADDERILAAARAADAAAAQAKARSAMP